MQPLDWPGREPDAPSKREAASRNARPAAQLLPERAGRSPSPLLDYFLGIAESIGKPINGWNYFPSPFLSFGNQQRDMR